MSMISQAAGGDVLAQLGPKPSAVRVNPERSSFTILVVEDNEPARYAVVRTLVAAGYMTLGTDSGETAIALAKQASAVLLDVNLPDLNGVQVCRALKRPLQGAALPVVMMSQVFLDDIHREIALSEGADAYLAKPLDPDALVQLMDQLLRGAPPSGSRSS
jgi:CheY-like chemotaxis protein